MVDFSKVAYCLRGEVPVEIEKLLFVNYFWENENPAHTICNYTVHILEDDLKKLLFIFT